MSIHELARLVKAMRAAQSRYFRGSSRQNLLEAKDAERRVDRALESILANSFPLLEGADGASSGGDEDLEIIGGEIPNPEDN